jgi:hypothetical protein
MIGSRVLQVPGELLRGDTGLQETPRRLSLTSGLPCKANRFPRDYRDIICAPPIALDMGVCARQRVRQEEMLRGLERAVLLEAAEKD